MSTSETTTVSDETKQSVPIVQPSSTSETTTVGSIVSEVQKPIDVETSEKPTKRFYRSSYVNRGGGLMHVNRCFIGGYPFREILINDDLKVTHHDFIQETTPPDLLVKTITFETETKNKYDAHLFECINDMSYEDPGKHILRCAVAPAGSNNLCFNIWYNANGDKLEEYYYTYDYTARNGVAANLEASLAPVKKEDAFAFMLAKAKELSK
ncbi:MAG: hypothetical protein Edafosvirus16_6 [Edafosvirus sp.]|uniref:Uncharacterized protein n=1 Tax=Edafosvirus sp. TaxID=2487765 RepID=A0A3G4ZUD8_9VIRU|nr:MAG: hypothetical protein Edafosvirus16_6 [Edafosvirus sp.]